MGTACGGIPSRPGGKSVPAARHARTKGGETGQGTATNVAQVVNDLPTSKRPSGRVLQNYVRL